MKNFLRLLFVCTFLGLCNFAEAQKPPTAIECWQLYDSKSKEDYVAGFLCLKQLAESGNADAQVFLVAVYSENKVVKEDSKQAFYWASKAAEQNDPMGLFLVAHCYMYGEGVEKNIELSINYMKKAARAGNKTAQEKLKKAEITW
jgi:TPR repeat protein